MRTLLKRRFPRLFAFAKYGVLSRVRSARMEAVFEEIFRENRWQGIESRSGPGSTLAASRQVREALPSLLSELAVRTLLDAPCGDFHWMRHVELADVRYVGVDVVGALVDANERAFGSATRRFVRRDLVRERLPEADAILCRDGLVHLDLVDGARAIENFRRTGARHLFATTFPPVEENAPIATGEWRPLNLERPPFSLPPPIRLIPDGREESLAMGKRLGVFALR